MDTNLDRMTGKDLVAEIKKLRHGIRHATVAGMNFVGTILPFGVCCQKRQIRFR